MWRAPFHTDGLDMCWLGLLLGFAMPDVLQTVGIKNWLLTVDTKILDIVWMLLKTGAGENLIWTTSSASAGFECKINFVYIVQFVHISFLFYACAQWGSPFLVYRLDSARLSTPHRTPRPTTRPPSCPTVSPTSLAEHAKSRMQTVTRHQKGALKPHPCRMPPCRTSPVMLNFLASTCQSR